MIIKNRGLQKRRRSFLFLNFFLAALVLALIWFLVDANFKISKRRSQLLNQIQYLEKEVQELEKNKSEYESSILRAETDDFWEQRIREQGYKKPGEEVVVVVQPEETEQEAVSEEKTFWQKLLEKLGF